MISAVGNLHRSIPSKKVTQKNQVKLNQGRSGRIHLSNQALRFTNTFLTVRSMLRLEQQLRLVRAEHARAAMAAVLSPPPAPSQLQAPMDYSPKIASSDLRLLSIFGWTLGGLFAVEWEDSPVGAYDEVAVLCALAWHPARPFAIGTWASHIFVSTPQACQGAREIWGLPAVSTSLEFSGGEEGEEAARRPRFRFSSSGAALSRSEAVDGAG
ncbi:hypothetical protein CYMTET_12276 [Cymbomonas tetramitiformis]|uniref:Uncharacterized protein n=1 Tax=Cymbomonas tetramitiformis TaxID=36881 RepID=A0AAE0GM08_9CHLO|nr:hypothetical protein CYMTET_12276 [Cymbomonas tetramitiformis]